MEKHIDKWSFHCLIMGNQNFDRLSLTNDQQMIANQNFDHKYKTRILSTINMTKKTMANGG